MVDAQSIERYSRHQIGKGGQGKVYKYGSEKSGLQAVKVLKWNEEGSNRLTIIREAFLSMWTDHVCSVSPQLVSRRADCDTGKCPASK